MARPLRIEYAGALYHLTSRGDRREAIYEDDEDRKRFLDTLVRQFGSSRDQARRRYRAFVNEGVRQDIWQGMRQQIYLGDEAFVKRVQSEAGLLIS